LIAQLSACYSDLYCLTDTAPAPHSLPTIVYPRACDGDCSERPVPVIPAAQAAAILFTSGSTGQPVPNQKTWGALVTGARTEADRLGTRGCPGMVIVATVPPQHMYGLESTVLMVMQNGLVLHAGRPFHTADIAAELQALPPPRGLVTTPVHLRALVADTAHLPRVNFLLSATAPLSPQLAAEAESRFAAPLYEIYGCTEAGQVATRRTVTTSEWRILPELSLRQDAAGTWVRGGHVETAVLLHDVIELLSNESFLLHGRTADVVNIAGKRTSLAHLNHHLNAIAGVRDGVFVMPEEADGAVTRLAAFVVAPGLSRATVMNALRQSIDVAFLPRPLVFVESLPRNDAGKLPREALSRFITRNAVKAG
jgi:acyl-coenzyme A synthetase/AMP-(fatty) acid ligase